MIIFLRRAGLGYGSVAALTYIINGDKDVSVKQGPKGYMGDKAGYILNTEAENFLPVVWSKDDWLFRWGCTSRTKGIKLSRQINTSKAIGTASDKRGFRMLCAQFAPEIIPKSYFRYDELPQEGPWVLRRSPHSQGRDLWLCDSKFDVHNKIRQKELQPGSWYASDYINKVAEYRVFVMEGRVVQVVRKIVPNEYEISWNVHNGGRYENIHWGEWPMDVIKVALKAHDLTGLDLSGCDVMSDKNGRAYLLEVNSAPSLKPKRDGGLGYSQKCVAKGIQHIIDNGKGAIEPVNNPVKWRDVIHPAVKGNKK